jgi:dihydrofolate reductase
MVKVVKSSDSSVHRTKHFAQVAESGGIQYLMRFALRSSNFFVSHRATRFVPVRCSAGMSETTVTPFRVPVSCVVACTPKWGIGKDGLLPWECVGVKLPGDINYFKLATSSTQDPTKMNAVIMGRSTWNSIPERYRPLPGRINIIITSSKVEDLIPSTAGSNVMVAASLQGALELIGNDPHLRGKVECAAVIGGVRLFEEAMFHPWFDALHLTQIETEFECDTHLTEKSVQFLANIDFDRHVAHPGLSENGVNYRYFEQPT